LIQQSHFTVLDMRKWLP